MATSGKHDSGACGVISTRRDDTHGRHLAGLVAAALLAASGLLATPAADAANADMLAVNVEIKPAADSSSVNPIVSVSRNGLSTFMSVKMSVRNTGGNTINKVVVQGTTTVYEGTNANPLLVASYAEFVNLQPVGSPSPNCTQPTSTPTNTVTCTIGQLAAGAGREFFLIFKMPTAGDGLNFNAHTGFSSGNSDNTPPADFIRNQDFPVTLTTLTPSDVNKKVRTVLSASLPAAGADFFTGQDAAVSNLNPFSTKVNVPAGVGHVTENSIEQADVTAAATCYDGPTPYRCYGLETQIDVKKAADGGKLVLPAGSTPYLTVWLRHDVSTFGAKPYPNVADTRIFYTRPAPIAPATIPVQSCATTGGPTEDVPCWVGRTSTVKGNKGYHQYEIRAKDNGKFSW